MAGRGAKRKKLGACKFKGGGDTIPSEVAWRGLGAGLGRSSPLPPPPPPGRSPTLPGHTRPSLQLHLPGQPRVSSVGGAHPRPASARASANARSEAPSFASHPLQSSFTKLSDFLSPKGVSWGEEASASRFPLRSPGMRARCPPRICDSINSSPHPADVQRGVGEGGQIWGREAARRGVGWGGSGEEEERGFNSGFTLFQIGI